MEYDKLTSDRLGEASTSVRARVEKARELQRKRFAGVTGTRGACLGANADMGPSEVREYYPLDDAGKAFLVLATIMHGQDITIRVLE